MGAFGLDWTTSMLTNRDTSLAGIGHPVTRARIREQAPPRKTTKARPSASFASTEQVWNAAGGTESRAGCGRHETTGPRAASKRGRDDCGARTEDNGDPVTETANSPGSRSATILRVVVALVVIGGLFALFRFLPVSAWIDAFKAWVAGQGGLGVAAFALAYVGVSLVPGGPAAVMTLAGGAVFGFVTGTIVISLASTLGATLAFLLARTVLRERASRMAASSPRFAGLNRAIEKEGGKIVALVRLSPLFPFTVVNYLFGLTPVRPLVFVLASWIAMLPGTAAYVYFGAALGDAATGADPVQKAIRLVLGVAAIVATAFIARFAAKAIRAAGVESGEDQAGAAGIAPGAGGGSGS